MTEGTKFPASLFKEMRFNAADGAWRVAFAFDAKRRAFVLVAATNQASAKDVFIANSSE